MAADKVLWCDQWNDEKKLRFKTRSFGDRLGRVNGHVQTIWTSPHSSHTLLTCFSPFLSPFFSTLGLNASGFLSMIVSITYPYNKGILKVSFSLSLFHIIWVPDVFLHRVPSRWRNLYSYMYSSSTSWIWSNRSRASNNAFFGNYMIVPKTRRLCCSVFPRPWLLEARHSVCCPRLVAFLLI